MAKGHFSWGDIIKTEDIQIIKETMDSERVEHIIFRHGGRPYKREIGHHPKTKEDSFIFRDRIVSFRDKEVINIEFNQGRN